MTLHPCMTLWQKIMHIFGKNGQVEGVTILKAGGADTSKLCLAQLLYLTNYWTDFQNKSQQNCRSLQQNITWIWYMFRTIAKFKGSQFSNQRELKLQNYDLQNFSMCQTNVCINFQKYHSKIVGRVCYGRPLLQAWLFPDLNTIPNNCVRENSL